MSLQNELDSFKTTWLDRVGPDVAKLVVDDNASLKSLADRAMKAGDTFPGLTLVRADGTSVDLGALANAGPLIVTFYRGGWCPYCNLELRAYQQRLGEIERLGARLVAVSPETPDNTLSTAEKNDLSFSVLSDEQGRLADQLGIRFQLSAGIVALYKKFGHDLPAHNGGGEWSLPMPATFVVAKGGRIAAAFVDPDYRKRTDPADAIAVLKHLAARAVA